VPQFVVCPLLAELAQSDGEGQNPPHGSTYSVPVTSHRLPVVSLHWPATTVKKTPSKIQIILLFLKDET